MEEKAMTNKIYFTITGTRFFEGDSFLKGKDTDVIKFSVKKILSELEVGNKKNFIRYL